MSTIYQTNGNKQELEANLYTSEKHIMVKMAEQNKEPPNRDKIINNLCTLNSMIIECIIKMFLKCSEETERNTSNVISSVHSLSHVPLFANIWAAAHQASLSITNSRTLLKLISIKSVIPSNHLILCHPLLLLPSIYPSIRVFSNESALRIRWPKYWSFSFSISPFNECSGLISFMTDWFDLLAVQWTLKILL